MTAKKHHLQGHHSCATPNLNVPKVLPIVLMIWFSFPLRAFYLFQSHFRCPSIRRRQQLGSSSVIQCFAVTDLAFSYLQGPLGNSFMMLLLFTSFGNNKPFHISENAVLPKSNLLYAIMCIMNSWKWECFLASWGECECVKQDWCGDVCGSMSKASDRCLDL